MTTMIAVVKVGAWTEDQELQERAETDEATVRKMVGDEIQEALENHDGKFEFRLTKLR